MNSDRNANLFYQNSMYHAMPGAMNMPNVSGMHPGQMAHEYGISMGGDVDQRIEMIERQLQRLEARISRLETPYSSHQYTTSVPRQEFQEGNYPGAMHVM